MYLANVHLKNIRCFKEVELDFEVGRDCQPFTLVLGDNATGKTALLKSIAMGLCDESSAAGLMKESEAGFIRRDEDTGVINLVLARNRGGKTYRLKTTISRRRGVDQIRQSVPKSRGFDWGDIFACAYGTARGTSDTGDIAGYSVLNAVYNLFNYNEGLQNPELVIQRIAAESPNLRDRVLSTLSKLLDTQDIRLSKSGILVDGPWGRSMPLRDLADGYKSTFLWLLDFLGWALSRVPVLEESRPLRAIVLIDELEQHLHPKWQERFVASLANVFLRYSS